MQFNLVYQIQQKRAIPRRKDTGLTSKRKAKEPREKTQLGESCNLFRFPSISIPEFQGLFQSVFISLLYRIAMFPAVLLNGKQPIAVNHTLHSLVGIVELFPLRNGITKTSANMRPTACALDSRQVIVSLVSICGEIPAESLEEGYSLNRTPLVGHSASLTAPRRSAAHWTSAYWRVPLWVGHDRIAQTRERAPFIKP